MRIRFNKLAMDTFGRLAGVRAYLDLVDQAMPEIEFQERERLQETADALGWDYEDFDVERQMLDERFRHWIPRFSAYSAIILLYTVLEVQLMATAAALAKKSETPFAASDMKGSGLEPALRFIERLTNHRATTQPEWDRISDLRELRHLIVHRIGTRGDSEHHRRIAEKLATRYTGRLEFPPEGFWSYGEAWVSVPLCRAFVDVVEQFFLTLYRALDFPTNPSGTIRDTSPGEING